MKEITKVVLCFFVVTFFLSQLQAQTESRCGTIPLSDSAMALLPWYGNNEVLDSFTTLGAERLVQNNSANVRSNNGSCPEVDNKIFLPIQFFWILAEGEAPPTEEDQQLLIDRVNKFYQDNGMPFRFNGSCPISWVNPDRLIIDNDLEAYFMYLTKHVDDVINVYVVDDIVGFGGVYNPVGDFIYVTKNVFLDEDNANTLNHELGHFFGLEHTHRNVHHPDLCYREVVSRTKNFEWYCALLALKWGKICDKNGDALCDTPADPNDGNSIGYTCPYDGNELDIYGDKFEPDESNIMSYFLKCRNSLTAGQRGVIWYNLIVKHNELLEIDSDYLNPDQYEPDNNAKTARLINEGESQLHSMHNFCKDEVDYLKFELRPIIGDYYIDIMDVQNCNNPVDEVRIYERKSDGTNGIELSSIKTVQNGIRRYAVNCGEIGLALGVNIEIKRNDKGQGKYIARLTKSNNLKIYNNGKECLSSGDTLSVQNLPLGATVTWSSIPYVTFSNNASGNPVTITNLNGNTPPIKIKATVHSNGCYEQITKDFELGIGGIAPDFEINELDAPCAIHGTIFTEGYYETNPLLNVDWAISSGTLSPYQGYFTNVKPNKIGWLTLSATLNDGCSIPKTVYKQIYVGQCNALTPNLIVNPNPGSNQVNITIENLNQENLTGLIQIIDVNSNVQLQQSTDGMSATVDVSLLQNGVYYVTWTNTQINLTKILIVNH